MSVHRGAGCSVDEGDEGGILGGAGGGDGLGTGPGGAVGGGAMGGAVVRSTGSHCGGQATPRSYVSALGRRWSTAAATPIKTRLLTLFDCFACGRCTDTHGYEGMKVSEKDGSVSIRRTNT